MAVCDFPAIDCENKKQAQWSLPKNEHWDNEGSLVEGYDDFHTAILQRNRLRLTKVIKKNRTNVGRERQIEVEPLISKAIEAWASDRGILPGASRAVESPLADLLIAFGRPAAKQLVEEMKHGTKYLDVILERIYGVNPVPETARGSHKYVTMIWDAFVEVAENTRP